MKSNDTVYVLNARYCSDYTIYRGQVISISYDDDNTHFNFSVGFTANTLQYGALCERDMTFRLTDEYMDGNYHLVNDDFRLTVFTSIDKLYEHLDGERTSFNKIESIDKAIKSYEKRISQHRIG